MGRLRFCWIRWGAKLMHPVFWRLRFGGRGAEWGSNRPLHQGLSCAPGPPFRPPSPGCLGPGDLPALQVSLRFKLLDLNSFKQVGEVPTQR